MMWSIDAVVYGTVKTLIFLVAGREDWMKMMELEFFGKNCGKMINNGGCDCGYDWFEGCCL